MPVELVERRTMATSAELIPESGFRLTGWHVLAGLIAFFSVVAAVNAFMLTSALRTMPGLDARNGYDVSQRYNAEIAAARAQAALGWTAQADLRRNGAGATIAVRLAAADGQPVTGLPLTIHLAHPATRALDVRVVAIERSPGLYRAEAAQLAAGGWDVITSSDDPARPFKSRARLQLKE